MSLFTPKVHKYHAPLRGKGFANNTEGVQQMAVRCSPDCPYDYCIISLVELPKIPGKGQEEGNQDDSNNSNSDSSNDSMDSQSDSGSEGKQGQTTSSSQPGSGEDKQDRQEPSSGESQEQPEQSQEQKPGEQQGKAQDSQDSDKSGKEEQQPESGKGKPQNDDGSDSAPGEAGAKQPGQSGEQSRLGSPVEDVLPMLQPAERPKPVYYEPVFDDLPHGHGAGNTDNRMAMKPTRVPKLPMSDGAFEARLRSVMTDNAFDRRVKGRKRGKLDMKALYRVPMKAENVFTLKEARKNKQYNVVLLVDESGSMSGGKAETAAKCAVFLAKAFEKINIDIAIVGFNRNITIRKDFDSKPDYVEIQQAIETMNYGRGDDCNNDWDGLNRAYKLFKPERKGENILLMLSDGHPASSSYPNFWDVKGNQEPAPSGTQSLSSDSKDGRNNLHHLVKAHNHRVKSIGIGIHQGGWQIPDHEVIKSIEELKPVIIRKLGARIKRG